VWSTVSLPVIVHEHVKNGQIIWEVGSNVAQDLNAAYDSRGRKLGTGIVSSCFQIRYLTTPDNSRPVLSDFENLIAEDVEITYPFEDPLTGRPLPFQLPPARIKMTTLETPHIRPFAKILRVDAPIPTAQELNAALLDPEKYVRLQSDGFMKVHLLSQGWGPYHANW
jgi:hypothetical protein